MLTRHRWAILLAAPLLVACAKGEGIDPDDEEEEDSLFSGYDHRRELTVDTPAAAGYSLVLTLDHAALVAEGKALEDGTDLRVVHRAGSDSGEIDRVLDPASAWNASDTRIWFQSQGEEASYWVIYGRNNAEEPPEDPEKVYQLFDGFNSVTLDSKWTFTHVGSDAAGDPPSGLGSRLRIWGETGEIGETTDSFAFVFRPLSGDLVIDAAITDAGGDLGDAARLGGVMVRSSLSDDSKYAAITLGNSPREFISSTRSDDGVATDEMVLGSVDSFPQYVAVQKQKNLFSTLWSQDGKSWLILGQGGLINALPDIVQIGIPFANAGTNAGWVEIDFIRVRKLVLPEPKVSVGDED